MTEIKIQVSICVKLSSENKHNKEMIKEILDKNEILKIINNELLKKTTC